MLIENLVLQGVLFNDGGAGIPLSSRADSTLV